MIKSSALIFLANITSAGLGFLGLSLFTRLLTPADYAFYALSIATASLLTPGLFTWLRLAVLQDQSARPDVDMRKTVLVSLVALLPLTALATIFLKTAFNPHPISGGLLFAMIWLAGSYEIILELQKARQEVKGFALTTILRAVIFLTLGLMLAASQAGYALVYAYIGAFSAGIMLYIFRLPPLSPIDKPLLKEWLKRSPAGTSIAMLVAIYAILDRFVINNLLGETAVGQFVASQDIARNILVAPSMAIGAIFIPKTIHYFETDKVALEKHLQYGLNLFMLVLLPSALGLALVGADLNQYILGAKFAEASQAVLPFCALAFLLQHLNNSYWQSIFHCHKVLLPLGAQMVFNLIMLFIFMQALIPHFGLYGAAMAFFIAESLNAVFSYFLVKHYYKGKIFSFEFVKIIALNILITGLCIALKPHIGMWGVIAFYGVTYALGILALNLLEARLMLTGLKRR
jgi:O-antigen/teichoic acid export membrane protein